MLLAVRGSTRKLRVVEGSKVMLDALLYGLPRWVYVWSDRRWTLATAGWGRVHAFAKFAQRKAAGIGGNDGLTTLLGCWDGEGPIALRTGQVCCCKN